VEEVTCRRDWYQTPTTIIISIFAKKVDKSKTKIEFKQDEVSKDVKKKRDCLLFTPKKNLLDVLH